MRLLFTALAFLLSVSLGAQPAITSWAFNFTDDLGFNNIPSNVQSVHYTNDDVYVSCTCIPGYDIGPWAGNPNTAENQDFCFKITRSPNQNSGNLIEAFNYSKKLEKSKDFWEANQGRRVGNKSI